jgi:hypothetical protein
MRRRVVRPGDGEVDPVMASVGPWQGVERIHAAYLDGMSLTWWRWTIASVPMTWLG